MSKFTEITHKRKFTPARLAAAYEETARKFAACLAHDGEHDFHFLKISPSGPGFHSILPEAFVELHAAGFVAISECSRCNAFSLAPLGQDMPTDEMTA